MALWRVLIFLAFAAGTLFPWGISQVPIGACASAAASASLSWHSGANQPLEKEIGGATLRIVRSAKRTLKGSLKAVSRAAKWWSRHLKRLAVFILVALAIALADRKLLAAWREEGLGVMTTYVPLMLYVYTRLFFDRRVRAGAKLMVLAAIAYGFIRADLLPDRRVVPGLIDDILLLAVAMRMLVMWSADEIVDGHAVRALNWRRRLNF